MANWRSLPRKQPEPATPRKAPAANWSAYPSYLQAAPATPAKLPAQKQVEADWTAAEERTTLLQRGNGLTGLPLQKREPQQNYKRRIVQRQVQQTQMQTLAYPQAPRYQAPAVTQTQTTYGAQQYVYSNTVQGHWNTAPQYQPTVQAPPQTAGTGYWLMMEVQPGVQAPVWQPSR